jgi:hypothetical protein
VLSYLTYFRTANTHGVKFSDFRRKCTEFRARERIAASIVLKLRHDVIHHAIDEMSSPSLAIRGLEDGFPTPKEPFYLSSIRI